MFIPVCLLFRSEMRDPVLGLSFEEACNAHCGIGNFEFNVLEFRRLFKGLAYVSMGMG
jgi:hypothetical protein